MSFAATADLRPPALVLGLGNPILGDDGVGWQVVDALEQRLATSARLRRLAGPVDVDRMAVGGLQLMERISGYDRVVLVDALVDGQPPGSVQTVALADIGARHGSHLDSAHDTTLQGAFDAGRRLGFRLPSSVTIVGVSVALVNEFDERLSPAVAAAVGRAAEAVSLALVVPDVAST